MVSLRHHSLVAWQRADDLFIKVHRLTLEKFPGFELYELGGQLRRAAYSVLVIPAICASISGVAVLLVQLLFR
jgi:23S rRNA-intervening sequence protein